MSKADNVLKHLEEVINHKKTFGVDTVTVNLTKGSFSYIDGVMDKLSKTSYIVCYKKAPVEVVGDTVIDKPDAFYHRIKDVIGIDSFESVKLRIQLR